VIIGLGQTGIDARIELAGGTSREAGPPKW